MNEKTAGEQFRATSDLSKGSDRMVSLRRPPPVTSHTAPAMAPVLRESASYSSSDLSTERLQSRSDGQNTNTKRYSDDGRDPKSAVFRKKSGFSSFMNSVLGSPRRINISNPENPVHVTHVGFDNETGQFTVS